MANNESKEMQEKLREKLKPNKDIAWEVLVDIWNAPTSN
jgi:hypothetical protein